jgi:multiple sugar transport system substrate-binding protein
MGRCVTFERRSSTILVIVLVLVLIVGLVGCQQVAVDRDVDQDSQVTHLTLWHGVSPPSNRVIFENLIEGFNQTHPDIEIEARYVGQPDAMIPKILTAVVGNAAPDILWYVPTITGQLVELGAIEPLDDWFAQSPYRDQLDPALLGTMRFENRLWSMPFATNNAAIFYRPSLFAKAGIKAVPTTWDQLRQTARQLTQDTDNDGRVDQKGMLLSLGKGEWTVFAWLPFIYSAQGRLLEETKAEPIAVLESPQMLRALRFAQALVKDGSVQLSAPERGYELDAFLAGRVAMQVTGPWVLPQLKAAGTDFGVFPFPVDQEPAAVLGGENLFLCRSANRSQQKIEAAYRFLDYILSPDFQLPWALGTDYIPANLAVRQMPPYRQLIDDEPSLAVFLAQMAYAKARPLIAQYNALSETLGQAIEATLLGRSPQGALTTAQAELDRVLRRASVPTRAENSAENLGENLAENLAENPG